MDNASQAEAITFGSTMRSRYDSYLSQQLLEQHNRIWGSYVSSPSDTDTMTASSLIDGTFGISSLILNILYLCIGGIFSFAYNAMLSMLPTTKLKKSKEGGCFQRVVNRLIDFNDGLRGLLSLAECFHPKSRFTFAQNANEKSTVCTSTISSLSKLSYANSI